MKVKFYGTRGSIPVCRKEMTEFGGNTTCIQVVSDNSDTIAICDAGSGIRELGKDILKKEREENKFYEEIFIGFTHFHWDHIQGFPFFEPAYDNKRIINLVAMGKNRYIKDMKSIFETQMQKEYFPVPLKKMGAEFRFVQNDADTFFYNGTNVTACRHIHPGGAYSYRLENNNQMVVISTDIEHGKSIDHRVVELAEGADLLIHDSQYTPEELKNKTGWGHSSYLQAIEVAKLAGVKKLALTHHDPDHDDKFLIEIEKICKDIFPGSFLAREGMTVSLTE